MMEVLSRDVHRTIDAVWRMESGRLIGRIARMVGDVGLAEDLAQEALVDALERWPRSGVPDNPGAWLMTAGTHLAIDRLRRDERLRRKLLELGGEPEPEPAPEDDFGDDVLALIVTCCHPALSVESRVALTLRIVGGLTTEEIARAFVVGAPTIGQRISRAKKTLAAEERPFASADLGERLPAVLEVVYLIFNEGYAATAGADWMRPALCRDALRLGRILAEAVPGEAEAHGLAALMELQASRLSARIGADGEPVTLLAQDRSRWDFLLIGRGLRALDRAEALGGAPGPYALQAAIAACHARARTPEATDWPRIAALYEQLSDAVPSPIVELNRAVALGMAEGPEVGLELADAIADTGALAGYHLLDGVRGDLLARLGRHAEAGEAFARAARQTANQAERSVLHARAQTGR